MLRDAERTANTNGIISLIVSKIADKPSWLLTAAVLVLAAVPRLTSLRAFLAHDETQYWEWARAFFFAVLQRDWLATIVGPGNPSVTLFWNHALIMGMKYAWAWLTGVQTAALATWPDFQPKATLDLLVERRLPIVVFNTLAVVIAYRLVDRLFGRRVALIAVVLLALDPFYLADSRTSRGEGLLASLMILAILLFLSYWVFGHSKYLILSGVVTGLAFLTKSSAISLVIWVIVAAPVLSLFESGLSRRQRLGRVLRAWGLWGLLAVATFWVLWPAMWVSPAKAVSFLLSFVDDVGVSGRENYFFGQVYQDETLPWFYLVVYILRVTPLAWLGLLAALGYLGHSYRRWSNLGEPGSLQPTLTILILVFALIYGVMMTVGILKRDWYLLPSFPALDIVAAVGLVWLFQGAWDRWGDRWKTKISLHAAWASCLAAVLVLQAATALPSHPYYYTYWNPLVLGNRWAVKAVRVGWDLDLSVGAYYLNSKPDAGDLLVATRSTRGFEQIFKGRMVRWVPNEPWIQADYLVVRTNHLQRGKIEPETLDYLSHLTPDHIVTIGGVDYLWIYEGPRAEYFAGPSTLAGKATLMGYDLGDPKIASGDTLSVKVYWRNEGMTPEDDLFLRIVDAGNYVWAESVAVPLPGFEESALTDGRIVESEFTLTVPVGMSPGTYLLQSGVYNHTSKEVLGYFTLPSGGDQMSVARPARVLSEMQLPIEHRLNMTMSPEVSLLGFDLTDDTLVLSDGNWLNLYWRANTDVAADYVIGLQLLDLNEKEVTYWLGRPVMSSYPTSEWMAGEIVRDPWFLELPEGISAGDYSLQLTLFDAETQSAVDQVSLGDVSAIERRREYAVPSMQETVGVGLDDRVTLLGYDLFSEPITGGGRLQLKLYWQAQQTMNTSYTVFVHLLSPDGTVVAQHDDLPVGGTIPTDDWAVGEVVADQHFMEFSALPSGEYRLIAGMYHPTSGERLFASDGKGFIPLQTLSIN
jgi:hypothetical protein